MLYVGDVKNEQIRGKTLIMLKCCDGNGEKLSQPMSCISLDPATDSKFVSPLLQCMYPFQREEDNYSANESGQKAIQVLETIGFWEHLIWKFQEYEREHELVVSKDIVAEAQEWETRRSILQLFQGKMQEDYRVKDLQGALNKNAAMFQRWHVCELQIMEWLQYAQERMAVISILASAFEPFGLRSNKDASTLKSDLSDLFSHFRNAVAASPQFSREKELCSLLRILSSMLEQKIIQLISSHGPLWDVSLARASLMDSIQDVVTLQSLFVQESSNLVLGMPTGQERNESEEGGKLAKVLFPLSRLASRCKALLNVLKADLHLEHLGKQTHIKGLPEIVNNYRRKSQLFRQATATAARVFDLQAYPSFEQEVLDFLVHANDVENAVHRVLRQDFDNTKTLDQALALFRQNRALLPQDVVESEVDYMLQAVMLKFGEELERVQAVYDKYKADPRPPRGMPPTAGAIAWARSLLRRVERPMRFISSVSCTTYRGTMDADEHSRLLLREPENRKIIRKYNRLAQTLLECESMWHEAWLGTVPTSLSDLQSPVLVYDCKKNTLNVNLEPSVIMALKEGGWFVRMGLTVPSVLHNLLLSADRLYGHHGLLSAAIQRLEVACNAAPLALKALVNILKGQFMTVWGKLGSTKISWASATMDGFVESFTDSVEKFCNAVRQAAKFHAILVERVVNSAMQVAPLRLDSDCNSENPLSFREFIDLQEKSLDKAIQNLIAKKEELEMGRNKVCQCFIQSAAVPEAIDANPNQSCFIPGVNAYYDQCNAMLTNALKVVTQGAMKAFAGLFDCTDSPASESEVAFRPYLVCLDIDIQGAAMKMEPSMEEVEMFVHTCIKRISSLSSTVIDKQADNDNEKQAQRVRDALSRIYLTVRENLEAVSARYSRLWNEKCHLELEGTMETYLEEMAELQTDLRLLPHVRPLTTSSALCLCYSPLKATVSERLEHLTQHATLRTHDQAAKELLRLVDEASNLRTALTGEAMVLSDMEVLVDSLDSARNLIADFELQGTLVQSAYEKLGMYGVAIPMDERELLLQLPDIKQALQAKIDSAIETVRNSQKVMINDVSQAAQSLMLVSKNLQEQWDACRADFLNSSPGGARGRLDLLWSEFSSHRKTWEFVVKGEKLLGLPASPLSSFSMLESKLLGLQSLYELCSDVEGVVKEYGAMEWDMGMEMCRNLLTTCAQYKERCKLVEKELRESYAYKEVRQVLDDILSFIPVLQGFGHPATKDRHWVELGKLASRNMPLPGNGLTLGHILEDRELMRKKKEDVEYLCQTILKEDAAEVKFNSVLDQWSNEVLTFSEHKQRGMIILKVGKTWLFEYEMIFVSVPGCYSCNRTC